MNSNDVATTRTTDPVPLGTQRLVATAGIGFAILLIVSFVLAGGETPDFNAAVSKWTEFAKDNHDNARIGALVMAFAAYEFLWFLGFLRAAMGRAETAARGFTRGSYVTFASGVVAIAGLTLGVFINAAALSRPDASPELIRGLVDVSGPGFGLASIGFATMLLSVAILNPRIRALPAWLGWLALIAGIAFLLQLGILLSDDFDNAFGIFYPIGYLGLVIFAVGSSVGFLRGLSRRGSVSDGPAAGARTPA
jgi:hypothetical protein